MRLLKFFSENSGQREGEPFLKSPFFNASMQKSRKREFLFPHKNVREVQNALIAKFNKIIRNESNLVAHAPTGIGKTAGTLPLALKKALDDDKVVFFLTPRHTQHQIAIDCLKKIRKRYNHNFVATDLIGKQWMCAIDGTRDLSNKAFIDYCKEAREQERCDPYEALFQEEHELSDKAENVIFDMERGSPLSTEEVIEISKRKGLCPYYLSLELAKKSKVIIGDYYHIFNPPVRKTLLSRIGKELGDTIIIVDEGHLLPQRVRGLLTSKLSNYILGRAKKEARDFNRNKVAKALDLYLESLEELAKEKLGRDEEAYVRKGDLIGKVRKKGPKDPRKLITKLSLIGRKVRKKEDRERSYCASVATSLEHWIKEKESYIRVIKQDGDYIALVHKALDPTEITSKVFDKCHASITMSGSLVPTEMYKDILGVNGKRVGYPSPFPDKNRRVFVYPEVTTKYSERDKDQYDKIAEKCLQTLNSVETNSAIFFPSYDFLEKIKKRLRFKLDGKIFSERGDLSKEERIRIFNKFKQEENATLLGVAAGSFSGGMDFPGKSLELVIVIGVPLAKPTLEIKSLIDYYDGKFSGSGWGYAYIYPAIRRVLQAAGRCIRSEDDKGAVVLMDQRYLWDNYSKPLPKFWNPIVSRNPEKEVEQFLS